MVPLQPMLTALTKSFIAGIPGLIYAIITLLMGYIVGKILGKITSRIMEEAKFDKYMSHQHFRVEISSLSGVIVSWIIYLVFIQQAAEFLNVGVITAIVNRIVGFIPGIVGAGVILIVADIIAIYVKDQIIGQKETYSRILGDFMFFLVIYVGIATALPLIGITLVLINQMLLLFVGAICLGLAIALGFGLKDTISELSSDYLLKKK